MRFSGVMHILCSTVPTVTYDLCLKLLLSVLVPEAHRVTLECHVLMFTSRAQDPL